MVATGDCCGREIMKKILCIAAHPDDMEMGMGGTLAKHRHRGDDVSVVICTQGIGGACGDPKTREQEAKLAANILDVKLQCLDYSVLKLNKPSREFELIVKDILDEINPDRLYTQTPFDYHQVHTTVSKCVTNAAKKIDQILYFEDVSSVSPEFRANAYVNITDYIDLKLESMAVHCTQSNKLYMQSNITRSLGCIRYTMGKLGTDPNGVAEAFAVQKFVL